MWCHVGWCPAASLAPPVPELRLSAPYSMSDGAAPGARHGSDQRDRRCILVRPALDGLTAAHPWLPFGTHVTVTDLVTGRSVTVVIDDRGPFAPGRIIDLSPEAFSALPRSATASSTSRLTW